MKNKRIFILCVVTIFIILSGYVYASEVKYPALTGDLTIKEDESNGQQRIYTDYDGNKYILSVSDSSVVAITSDGSIKVQYFRTNDRYSLTQNNTIKTIYNTGFNGIQDYESLAGQHTWTKTQESPDPVRGNSEYDYIYSSLKIYHIRDEIGYEGVGGVDDTFYGPERTETGTVSARELDTSLDGILKSGDNFLTKASSDATIPEETIQDISGTIFNTLFIVGIIIAILIGAVLGIKFITSGLDGKAEIKQLLLPYTIGVVVLFGAFTIWKIVLTILQN